MMTPAQIAAQAAAAVVHSIHSRQKMISEIDPLAAARMATAQRHVAAAGALPSAGGASVAGMDDATARLQAAARAAAGQLSNNLGVPSAATSASMPMDLSTAAAAGRADAGGSTSTAIALAASQAMVAGATTGAARAAAFAAALNAQHAAGGRAIAAAERHANKPAHFETELDVNDFPQNARWKVTHKDSLQQISEFTGAAITTRGQYYPPGKPVPPGERRLYLLIEGPTERCVKEAKNKIKSIIEEVVAKQALPGGFSVGKYKV